jgi:hypothetical protein
VPAEVEACERPSAASALVANGLGLLAAAVTAEPVNPQEGEIWANCAREISSGEPAAGCERKVDAVGIHHRGRVRRHTSLVWVRGAVIIVLSVRPTTDPVVRVSNARTGLF